MRRTRLTILVAVSILLAACGAGETGSPLAEDVRGTPLSTASESGVGGAVLAGPVCPVERPGDLTCAPRPVNGAVLIVIDANGTEVARVTTDATGLYRIALQPGDYTLVAQPVEGLMAAPGPLPFSVGAGGQTALDVPYETGIR
jgi:hypothetical protein